MSAHHSTNGSRVSLVNAACRVDPWHTGHAHSNATCASHRHRQPSRQTHIQNELKMSSSATDMWVREFETKNRRAPTRAVRNCTWDGANGPCDASGTAAVAAAAAWHRPRRPPPAAAVPAPATVAGGRHRRPPAARGWSGSRPRPPPRVATPGPPAAARGCSRSWPPLPPQVPTPASTAKAAAAGGLLGRNRRCRCRRRGWLSPLPPLPSLAWLAAIAALTAGCRRLWPPPPRLLPSPPQPQP